MFLITAVDFLRTYADRTHHGKEDILFKDLAKKQLKAEEKQIMDELIQEHISVRKLVGRLSEASSNYEKGSPQSLVEIQNCLKELVRFYPIHILKEDKHFFYPILEFFNKEENDLMLSEFWEFDRKLIHEKYRKTVEEREK